MALSQLGAARARQPVSELLRCLCRLVRLLLGAARASREPAALHLAGGAHLPRRAEGLAQPAHRRLAHSFLRELHRAPPPRLRLQGHRRLELGHLALRLLPQRRRHSGLLLPEHRALDALERPALARRRRSLFRHRQPAPPPPVELDADRRARRHAVPQRVQPPHVGGRRCEVVAHRGDEARGEVSSVGHLELRRCVLTGRDVGLCGFCARAPSLSVGLPADELAAAARDCSNAGSASSSLTS